MKLAKNKRYNYNNCNVSVFSLKLYISKTFKIKYKISLKYKTEVF